MSTGLHPHIEWPTHDWQIALDRATAQGDERPTWAYSWPAGERLQRLLPGLVPNAPLKIIDLGCGRGLLGMSCLLRWKQCHVTFCDASPEVLTFVAATAAANKVDNRCRTLEHRWGTPLPHADLILGGDILYRPECHDALLHSIASSQAARCILSDPREVLEENLPSLAAQRGLNWQQTFDPDLRCSIIEVSGQK